MKAVCMCLLGGGGPCGTVIGMWKKEGITVDR